LAISYDQAKRPTHKSPGEAPVFAEGSRILAAPFNHTENEYNEYKVQTLLPHMFSRSGPFVSTGDVNKDGNEDFYIGGAAGQAGSLYVQQNGSFVKTANAAFEGDKKFEDIGSALFDADQDGDLDLYVVSGGSEYKEGADQYNDRLYINDGKETLNEVQLSRPLVVDHVWFLTISMAMAIWICSVEARWSADRTPRRQRVTSSSTTKVDLKTEQRRSHLLLPMSEWLALQHGQIWMEIN
jgi:hypothetical protein